MSRTRRLSAALLLLSCLPFPALAASDAADSAYWDYRIPAHHWHQWTASLSGNGNHAGISRSDDIQTQQGQLQGQLRTAFAGGQDSDPLFQFWALDLSMFGARSHDEYMRILPGDNTRAERTTGDVMESIIGQYRVRTYPWAFPLGFTAFTQHRFVLAQEFASVEGEQSAPGFRNLQINSSETDRWLWFGDLALGTGLGRVRDVTPVYEAQVLEDRLIGSGALLRPLSRSARGRLAALFTVQGAMTFAHGRSDKYFWEELERVLVEDGALESGSLTLFEAHRILEPTTIRGAILRRAGWFVGPSIRLLSSQRNSVANYRNTELIYLDDTLSSASESNFASDAFERRDYSFTSLTLEFHHPAGPNWQFDVSQESAIRESGDGLLTNAFASAAWVVADRWLATAHLYHYQLWGGQGLERAPEQWTVDYGADLSYFLEDRWALTLSGVENQRRDDFSHSRQGAYSLGISYVFSGLFEAPGLTAAMRPIPGGR